VEEGRDAEMDRIMENQSDNQDEQDDETKPPKSARKES
jgi:hypothetical protein